MTDCDRLAPLVGARPGELTAEEAGELARHLAACAGCRDFAADVAATEGMVAEGLARIAARRDFATFSDGVMDRIPPSAWRAGDAPPARASGASGAGGLVAWARRHRILAGLGALAPALAGLAIYLYISGGAPDLGVEVSSETLAPVVLETSDGPVILVGDGADET